MNYQIYLKGSPTTPQSPVREDLEGSNDTETWFLVSSRTVNSPGFNLLTVASTAFRHFRLRFWPDFPGGTSFRCSVRRGQS